MNEEMTSLPKWAVRFLRTVCPEHLQETIEGDLIQNYNRDKKRVGRGRARRRLISNVLRFFRPGIILQGKFSCNLMSFMMLVNHLKMALRVLMTRKTGTVIHLTGLVLGMVCVIIVSVLIRYETSFDTFHSNSERIYRVVRIGQAEGQTTYRTGVAYPLPVSLRNELLSIEAVTSVSYQRNAQIDVLENDGSIAMRYQEAEGCAFVDPFFFNVFDFHGTSFKWVSGNPEQALREPFTLVLTRSLARKYFGDDEALGRTLKIEKMVDFKVTGVIEDLPSNSDFPFKVLFSYATLPKVKGEKMWQNWFAVSDVHQAYIRLEEGISKEEAEQQITRIHTSHVSKELAAARSYFLQPLKEVHRDARFGNYNLRTVTDKSIWATAIVGGFLLITVCINFINLSTAHAVVRSKEVAIRKVMGSTRAQLVCQSLAETLIIVSMAAVISLIASELLLSRLKWLTGMDHQGGLLNNTFVWTVLICLVIFITIAAGFYPGFFLSRYTPVTVLKKNLNSVTSGGVQLRRLLVLSQFTITQVLVICTVVVASQMHFFRTVDMGFDKEAVINVEVPGDGNKLSAFENSMLSVASVSKVSFSSSLPSGLRRARWFDGIRRKDADTTEVVTYEHQAIDHHYLELYNIKLLRGRNFHPHDSANLMVINQALSAKLGFSDPLDAIGRELVTGQGTYVIIGVTQNFYTNSFKEEPDKVGFVVQPANYNMASIKLNLREDKEGYFEGIKRSIDDIRNHWEHTFSEGVFSYSFLDENIAAFYEEEARFSNLFQLFSVVFMAIGCLGLYGLISFIAGTKVREVAIRKVLGASIHQILLFFFKDYIRIITLSFVIAAPVAYYFMSDWLQTFAYRIEMELWFFILPGLLILAIALLSILGQSLKAAMMNPSGSLKGE